MQILVCTFKWYITACSLNPNPQPPLHPHPPQRGINTDETVELNEFQFIESF